MKPAATNPTHHHPKAGRRSSAMDSKDRRVTNINPNFKMNDILEVRIDSRHKVTKPDPVYKFHCGGDLASGKHVEWNASFDKPLEQLIYPSLQRFDLSDYEEKKKQNLRLHGNYDSHFSTGSNNRTTTFAPLEAVKLTKHDPLEDQKMFIHAPTWSVKITQAPPMFTTTMRPRTRTATEETMRPRTRTTTEDTVIRSVAEADDEMVTKYASIENEIDIEGEKYLRNKMKEKYQQSLRNEELERELQNELATAEASGQTTAERRRQRKRGTLIKPVDLENADLLFSSISKGVALQLTQKSRLRPSDGNTPRVKLNQLTAEENSYLAQKADLEGLLTKESDHMLDGLLYYRVHNELNRQENEERKSFEQGKMTLLHQRSALKYSNQLSQRLSRSLSSSSTGPKRTANEMHIGRNEDVNVIHARQLRALEPLVEASNMNRLKRAVASKNTGFSHEDLDSPDRTEAMLPDYAYAPDRLNPETKKRQAQDKLLLLQLDAGVLPESFIVPSSDPNMLKIDLSNYGIGDTRGLCLGNCIGNLDRLQTIGLSDNRLTALSIPTIIHNLHFGSVMHIDLSLNNMREQGARALAGHFRQKNVVRYLDISNCGITCVDIGFICGTLTSYVGYSMLEEMYLSCNKIGFEGAQSICAYLSSKLCKLLHLDLSWNNIAEAGSTEFAAALTQNISLTSLNLASNSMNDLGGQRFIHSIGLNSHLRDINLSQNGISNRSCFVVAKVIRNHPSMETLDLSLNPLGEAGARSIFRAILRGLSCFVIMKGCSYQEDLSVFNNTYPSLDNPYVLDMSDPYKAAVLAQLMIRVESDPEHCSFENFSYRENPKANETSLSLAVNNDLRLALKSTGEVWVPPTTGFIRFNFQQAVFVPAVKDVVDKQALGVLQIIIEKGRTDMDRRMWLKLLCQDIYFTTTQARNLIAEFVKSKTIVTGGLSVLDIVKSLWKFLVDTENMYDFLYENVDSEHRRDLVQTLTLKRYKFNWKNPTGHWRLNLEDKEQRSIMMQIIAINAVESEYSQKHANRNDTSQQGNWFNFRNEKYTVDRMTREISIDKDFIKAVPSSGSVEFDYVSTTRPVFSKSKEGEKSGTNFATNDDDLLTDDEFYLFQEKVGLSSRTKISSANGLFVLMDLQLASTKYYFTVEQVHSILDSFADEWDIQAKVVVAMFSRVKELHRMDMILRHLDSKAQLEVCHRIGVLNLLNPLKIAFDYVLSLKYLDNRIMLVALMELAAIESADQITEDPSTELPIATMYGAYTRALNETRPEVMKISFADFGERSKVVSWPMRRDIVKKFLVGSYPVDDTMYQVIQQYKELEAAGALASGPIDLQYASFQKTSKASTMRTAKSNQKMSSLMREASKKKSVG